MSLANSETWSGIPKGSASKSSILADLEQDSRTSKSHIFGSIDAVADSALAHWDAKVKAQELEEARKKESLARQRRAERGFRARFSVLLNRANHYLQIA